MKTTKEKITIIMTIILIVVILILNLIDYCQTIYAVQVFGTGVEANPIVRFLFENNYAVACNLKLIGVPITLALLGLIVIRFDRRQIFGLYLLLVCFGYVVIHNFIVLSRLGLL